MKKTLLIPFVLIFNLCIAQTTTTINVTLGSSCSTLGNDTASIDDDFKLYPNPSNGIIFLEGKNIKTTESFTLKIYDLKGVLVYEDSNVSKPEVNLENLQNGFYLVKITTDKIDISKKLIINK